MYQIKLDGVDIRLYNTHWLRDQMAFVTQEGSLFDGTIEENLRYGKPDATLQEIEQACKDANAHDFISLMKKAIIYTFNFLDILCLKISISKFCPS